METGLKLQANGRQSHVDVMEAVCSQEKAAARYYWRTKEKLWYTSPIASQLKFHVKGITQCNAAVNSARRQK